MEYEEAFTGEVLDARAKMEGEQGHLIPESPWESVLVKWDLVRCRTPLPIYRCSRGPSVSTATSCSAVSDRLRVRQPKLKDCGTAARQGAGFQN